MNDNEKVYVSTELIRSYYSRLSLEIIMDKIKVLKLLFLKRFTNQVVTLPVATHACFFLVQNISNPSSWTNFAYLLVKWPKGPPW